MPQERLVFVTVGTTSFDQLIQTICSSNICKILKDNGYQKLVIQIGRGTFEPSTECIEGVEIEFYRYKDSIAMDIEASDLVISHAGAGSCLEVLEAKKPLIVVINEELMGNHQTELAAKLYKDGHLLYGTCSQLAQKLENLDISQLKPMEPTHPERFASFLDKVMGVS